MTTTVDRSAFAVLPATPGTTPATLSDSPFLRHPAAPPRPDSPEHFHARVEGRSLLQALRDIESVRGHWRPPVPILATVHAQPVDGGLQLTSYDYETTVRRTIPADVAAGGPIAVTPRFLRLAAEAAGSEVLTMAAGTAPATRDESAGPQLVVSDGYLRHRTRLMDAKEYPAVDALPTDGVAFLGRYSWAQLHDMTSPGLVAAADETPPVLTCLHVSTADGMLRVEATDRYRLHVTETPAPLAQVGVDLLVRATSVRRLLTRFGKHLEFAVYAVPNPVSPTEYGTLRFETAAGWASLTLHAPTAFPPVQRLFPLREDWRGAVLVDRAALAVLVARVAAAGSDRDPVELTIQDDIRVRCDNGYGGAEGYLCPSADWHHTVDNPPGVHIAARASYLLDALSLCRHDVVEIGYTLPSKPLFFAGVTDAPRTGDHAARPNWTDAVDTSSVHLLMPTRSADRSLPGDDR